LPVLVEIAGEPGVGKTHLSLTFPKPYIFDTTPKREAEIVAYKVLGADAKNRYQWVKNYQILVNALNKVLQEPEVKTVIIDTGSDLQGMAVEYDIKQRERQKLMPYEYGRIREMIDEDITEKVVAVGKNLVMTSQMDDEYVNGVKTGRRIIKGYKRMAHQADIRVYMTLGAAEIEVMPGGLAVYVTPKPSLKPERKALVIKNRFVDMTEAGYQKLEGNITAENIKALIPQNLVSMVWTE
jgi:hypothetical protein